MKRREFLGASVAILPAVALGIPLLSAKEYIPQQALKVFCLESGGDTSYIIAESSERVKHWWFTELGGEPIPDDAEVIEISPDAVISQGIEDLDDISEEDQKYHLYYKFVHRTDSYGWTELEPVLQFNYIFYHNVNITPTQHANAFHGADLSIRFYIKKSAGLFLQETIDNKYPIPCCFCTTAG